jgi:threonine dehydrogenase-like Zn-dependent dehydrogenase
MLVYRGQAPTDMAVDASIAALPDAFGFPIKFGYAAVGRVVAVGPGVGREWLDRMVFAFNPHESHFVADLTALLPVPDGLAPEAAVFLPNMETAVSLVMDGRPVIGEQVAVVGQGVVGLLTTALLANLSPATLTTVDRFARRREWSARLGGTAVAPEGIAPSAWAAADLTFELSGDPRGLDLAIALTGDYGRVVIGSWYGRKRADLDLGGRFHRAHMRLIGSQVSSLSPQWLGRWTKERRLGVAWQMLRRHQPERLITHRLPIERATEAYRLLEERPDETIQLVFTYD